jgi:hypothetical protein
MACGNNSHEQQLPLFDSRCADTQLHTITVTKQEELHTNLLQVLRQAILQQTHGCEISAQPLQHWLLEIVVHSFKNLIPSFQAFGFRFQGDNHITLPGENKAN